MSSKNVKSKAAAPAPAAGKPKPAAAAPKTVPAAHLWVVSTCGFEGPLRVFDTAAAAKAFAARDPHDAVLQDKPVPLFGGALAADGLAWLGEVNIECCTVGAWAAWPYADKAAALVAVKATAASSKLRKAADAFVGGHGEGVDDLEFSGVKVRVNYAPAEGEEEDFSSEYFVGK